MSIKTNKRLALGVIAALVFSPFAAIAPANAAISALTNIVVAELAAGATNLNMFVEAGTGTAGSLAFNIYTGGAATVATADIQSITSGTGLTADAQRVWIAPGTLTTTSAAVPAFGQFPGTTVGADVTGAFAAVTGALTLTGTPVGLTTSSIAGSEAGTVYTIFAQVSGGTIGTPAAGNVLAKITVFSRTLEATLGDGGVPAAKGAVNGVAGPANTVTVRALDSTNTAGAFNLKRLVTVSGAGAKITTASAAPVAVATDGLTAVITGNNADPSFNNLTILTPTAGTVTVSIFTESAEGSGIFGATAASTVTITVNAVALTNVFSAAKSTSFVGLGATASTTQAEETTDLTDPIIVAATFSGTVEAANVQVIQKDSAGTNLTSGFKVVTATITGGGLLGTVADTPTGASVTSSAAATTNIFVFPNGTAGVATLTVTLDGAVVETLTISFYGAVTSLVATSKVASVDADGGLEAGVLEVIARDANSILVPGATVTFDKAADATLVSTMNADGTTTAAGKAIFSLTPIALKYGTTTVTVKSGTVISNPITVVLAHNQIATATLALDAATYLPGVKGKLTMAAKDKNGLIVPDALTAATTLVFSSNLSTTSTFGTQPAFVAGAYAQDVFAPALTNLTDWTISVKITANAIFATTLVPAAGATLTATAKVGIPPAPVVVPPVVYDNPTLSFVKDGGRVILSGTAVDGEGDIIIYTKKVGTTAWQERAKTLEVAAPGDFNGAIKAPKSNVLIRVKQEGTGQFSNQIIVLK